MKLNIIQNWQVNYLGRQKTQNVETQVTLSLCFTVLY